MAMTMRAALLLSLSLAVAACAPGAPTPTQPDPPAAPDALAQVGRWQLQGATDAKGRPIADVRPHGKAVHALVFAEGALGIEGGCNHIGGRYWIHGRGRLVVPEIQSTLMACSDEALMAADAAVSGLLRGTSEWRIAESYPEQLFLDHADARRRHWVADPSRD